MEALVLVMTDLLIFLLVIVGGFVFSTFLTFLWTAIHEFSHLIAVKLTCGTYDWSMKLWPKLDKKGITLGMLEYNPVKPLTDKRSAIISLAPYIPETISAILFPILVYFNVFFPMILFFFVGVIELISNSCNNEDCTDTIKAAKALNISSKFISIPGFILGTASLAFALIIWIYI